MPSKPWGWRSNGQEQVPHETATSANARHECFVMDASVSLKIAETAEMDDKQVRAHQTLRRRHTGDRRYSQRCP